MMLLFTTSVASVCVHLCRVEQPYKGALATRSQAMLRSAFVVLCVASSITFVQAWAPGAWTSLSTKCQRMGAFHRRAGVCSLRAQSDEYKETPLTDEQCDTLDLPRGTKLVGEMSEDMKLRLSAQKSGTYEDTNQLRYFSNEKFRKENYFGKQKLQVNAKRMAAKVRRAEIEERMDAGYSYDQAVAEVDAIIKAAEEGEDTAVPPPQPAGTKPLESTLRELFQLVDTDQSGTITAGEMATAFVRLREPGADQSVILQDVWSVMNAADMDQNGIIDFDEFKSAAETFMQMAPGQPLPKKQAAPNIFGGLGKLFGR